MEILNTLNLTRISGGTKLKQGDFGSVLSYSLADENGQEITSFDTKTAYINLVLDDKILFTTTTQVDISRVTFHIDKAIPTGLYYLEIKIDDYVFPSDKDSVILIEEGATAYDLKDLIPNYDVVMTITTILSDLAQKGMNITDLQTKVNAIYSNALSDHAEIIQARGGQSSLDSRLDGLDAKDSSLQAQIISNDADIDSTNTRINNLVANAGNGTVPSEVIEMRTGDDGFSYTTASEAVKHTGTIVENSFKVPITLTAGYYIVSANGTYALHSNQAYKATDFIDITGASIIKLDTAFSVASDGYAFYDANKTFISGSSTFVKTVSVPASAVYFRFTAYNIPDNTVRMFLVYPLTKLMPAIDKINKQDLNGKFTKLNNLPYTLTPNQYVIFNSGKTADIVNTKFLISSYVNVSSIDVLSINTKFSGYGDGYAFYDVNKVYISGSNVNTTTINVPANAVYFRFSAYNIDTNLVTLTGTNSLNFIKEQISTISKQIQPPTNYYYGIGKTLMIGDSLTSGAYYDDVAFKGASINQNVPYYLGKVTNNEVKNAGISGSTPMSWHSTEFSKYDYTQYDTFFIWFGTNAGLTDTMDADVNSKASYNDYASTNTGTYCKLIEEIKAVNPDASIHICTIFASSGNLATTNRVINQIATKYDLNIIDMSDLSPANYPNLHLGINNVHFGKSGNIYIANRIANDLNSYFASNQLKLEFGLTPRTN
ncbi:SGNH/GDSL hydrolase family protein [Streptococcus parauberis]|uniref:SGNH hydrolase-type esterase domain-containing protein n=1 Tax=Streptococcus parauberis KRS-02083 TaxID=1207545 RepID=A0ABN0ISC7_9STRE|nr:SGNH/GDSL hydrolase family protein [Streptococcus parauberis]EMG25785.1 hypothetical protein SPJ1_1196 [Streptococcus parauberis KRS-02083]QBX27508.1 hypothetical protein Javan392_0052 [Streptococcus phage Javan392]WEM64298.1 SGNH/GDSL hydrolase family protein [Streptococcus parauberis]WOF46128.1 SGNH/GDSL hydrolase family protein [Streptococcus parauberis]